MKEQRSQAPSCAHKSYNTKFCLRLDYAFWKAATAKWYELNHISVCSNGFAPSYQVMRTEASADTQPTPDIPDVDLEAGFKATDPLTQQFPFFFG